MLKGWRKDMSGFFSTLFPFFLHIAASCSHCFVSPYPTLFRLLSRTVFENVFRSCVESHSFGVTCACIYAYVKRKLPLQFLSYHLERYFQGWQTRWFIFVTVVHCSCPVKLIHLLMPVSMLVYVLILFRLVFLLSICLIAAQLSQACNSFAVQAWQAQWGYKQSKIHMKDLPPAGKSVKT